MLELIAKQHKHWIEVVKGYGEYNYAEDIVQEMYIKVQRYDESKVINNGEVNGGFIRFMLMSLTYDLFRKKRKVKKISIGEGFEIKQEVNEEDEGYGRFLQRLDKEMEKWEEYERKMFRLYIGTYGTQNVKTHGLKISIRKFSEDSEISVMEIFMTLRRCKQRIKDNLSEDWQDFINGEYERI